MSIKSYFTPQAKGRRRLDTDVNRAIRLLAREHYFFERLGQDLKALSNDLRTGNSQGSVAEIRNAFHDFGYIGRTEQRLSRLETNLQEQITHLEEGLVITGTVRYIEQLRLRINTESRSVLQAASRYEGRIRQLLEHLRATIQAHEIEQAQAVLLELEQAIKDTNQWIAALSSDLPKVRNLERDLDRKIDFEGQGDNALGAGNHSEAAHFFELAGKHQKVVDALRQKPTLTADDLILLQRTYLRLGRLNDAINTAIQREAVAIDAAFARNDAHSLLKILKRVVVPLYQLSGIKGDALWGGLRDFLAGVD